MKGNIQAELVSDLCCLVYRRVGGWWIKHRPDQNVTDRVGAPLGLMDRQRETI